MSIIHLSNLSLSNLHISNLSLINWCISIKLPSIKLANSIRILSIHFFSMKLAIIKLSAMLLCLTLPCSSLSNTSLSNFSHQTFLYQTECLPFVLHPTSVSCLSCHICALSSAISQVWHTPFCTQPSLSNLSSFLHHRKVNMRAFPVLSCCICLSRARLKLVYADCNNPFLEYPPC